MLRRPLPGSGPPLPRPLAREVHPSRPWGLWSVAEGGVVRGASGQPQPCPLSVSSRMSGRLAPIPSSLPSSHWTRGPGAAGPQWWGVTSDGSQLHGSKHIRSTDRHAASCSQCRAWSALCTAAQAPPWLFLEQGSLLSFRASSSRYLWAC